jgi:hypothetical protein
MYGRKTISTWLPDLHSDDTLAREVLLKGRCCIVILILTNIDQLLYIQKILFTFLSTMFIRRSTVLRLSPQLVFPALSTVENNTTI